MTEAYLAAAKGGADRLMISEVLVKTFKSLNLEYPTLKPEQEALLQKYRVLLEDGEA